MEVCTVNLKIIPNGEGDRFGSRRIILAGSILIGISYLMLSRINSLATFYMSFLITFTEAIGISNVIVFSVVTR